jgi:predicted nucleic acid-binding protein
MNGLRLLATTPIVPDTMVLLRMLSSKSPYVDALERIKKEYYHIAFSTSMRREWMTKSYDEGMPASIVVRKLEELNQLKKLRKCNKTRVDKTRKLFDREKCKKPNDKDDVKFVIVALAEEATILTEDRVLLNLDPYKCANTALEIKTPSDFLKS